MPSVTLAEIDACLIMVRHAGEGEEPERTERQRQDQDVPRPSVGMCEHPLQRLGGIAVNGE